MIYELLVIESSGGVDKVLIAKESKDTDARCIEIAEETADFRGEVYIEHRQEISLQAASIMGTMRPYIG